MMKLLCAVTLGAIALAGCAQRSVQTQPPIGAQASLRSPAPKLITRTADGLVLPDGTRVTPDSSGGFSLPNGDYVRRERGALLLPTGARCLPNATGYACP